MHRNYFTCAAWERGIRLQGNQPKQESRVDVSKFFVSSLARMVLSLFMTPDWRCDGGLRTMSLYFGARDCMQRENRCHPERREGTAPLHLRYRITARTEPPVTAKFLVVLLQNGTLRSSYEVALLPLFSQLMMGLPPSLV
jgi:hypothetical protein